jgi:hypothetical protein
MATIRTLRHRGVKCPPEPPVEGSECTLVEGGGRHLPRELVVFLGVNRPPEAVVASPKKRSAGLQSAAMAGS